MPLANTTQASAPSSAATASSSSAGFWRADAGVDVVLAVQRGVELVAAVEPAHRRRVDGGAVTGMALLSAGARVHRHRLRTGRPSLVLPGEVLTSPCSISQRSASIAAMQPVPAAVTAWR